MGLIGDEHAAGGAAARARRRAGIARLDAGPQAIAVALRTERSCDAAIDRMIAASDGRLAWRGERLVYARETSSAEERKSVTLKLITKLAEVQG